MDKQFKILLTIEKEQHAQRLFYSLCNWAGKAIEKDDCLLLIDHNDSCGWIGDKVNIPSIENNWVGEVKEINPTQKDKDSLKRAIELMEDLSARCKWETKDDHEYGETCIAISGILNSLLDKYED